MKSLRMKISRLSGKKVPALSLVLVAVVGAVAGVFAASIAVTTSFKYAGEAGTIHTNAGNITIVDNGLAVVSGGAVASTSGTFGSTASVNNALAPGNWYENVTFTQATAFNGHTYTAIVSVYDAGGVAGSLVKQATFTLTGSSTPAQTIFAYIDLGVTTLDSPVTLHVTVS